MNFGGTYSKYSSTEDWTKKKKNIVKRNISRLALHKN